MKTFRFAPSPNGYLHLGHAYSVLLNFDLARACGGRLLLRIEDIDTGRARPEFEAAIYEDLAWLGLAWETPVRRQSEHFDDYANALEKLDRLELLYACDCTRGDIARVVERQPEWRQDPDGAPIYPGTCKAKPHAPARELLRAGGVALRLDMAKACALIREPLVWREHGMGEITATPPEWGDVILARKDTPASYHIAVVVDDALQGVTDVVRGRDLFRATSVHRLLQHLLGVTAPDYRHHPLMVDEAGEKLAKRRFSKSLRDLRAEGATPADVRRMTGLPPAS
jgi:glutamyl-Q tRNA(Asp) synthetase